MKKIFLPLLFLALLPIGAMALSVSQVKQGGTGSSTLTGILVGNGTSPLNTLTIGSNLTLTGTTLSASAGGGGIATSSILANTPLIISTSTSALTFSWSGLATTSALSSSNLLVSNGGAGVYGVATTSETCSAPLLCATHAVLTGGGAITWSGLSTTSQPSSSNLLVSNGGAGVYGVATTSETCSSPLSCTAHAVLTGGGAITIQNASASQGGAIQITDFNRLYAATTTFTSPLIYTASTNAITFSGMTTTTPTPSSSNVLVSNGGTGVYGTATSSETCSAPILCGAFAVLGGGGAISFTGQLALASGGTNASLSGANQILFMNSGNTAVSTNANLIYNGTGVGVGSSTPWATLSVIGANATSPLFAVATSTLGNASSTEPIFMIDQNSHHITGGIQPTVSACGTSPSINGNDNTMMLTTGSTGVTECTITFAKAWTIAPVCSFDEQGTTATVTLIGSTSKTVLSLGISASLTSAKIGIICQAFQ